MELAILYDSFNSLGSFIVGHLFLGLNQLHGLLNLREVHILKNSYYYL